MIVSKRNVFWGNNDGKSVVISDITAFAYNSLMSKSKSVLAEQMDHALL